MPPRAGAHASQMKKKHKKAHMQNHKQEVAAKVATVVDKFMETHDADHSGTLNFEEFKGLLNSQYPSNPPDDETVKTLVSACNGEIKPDRLKELIAKYDGYIKDRTAIDALFSGFEQGKKELTKDELKGLLDACAATIPNLPKDAADDEDTEYVFQMADLDKSGTIDMSEVKLALATWKQEISHVEWKKIEAEIQAKPEDKPAAKGSSACTLL